MNPLGYLSAITTIAAASMFGLWQFERAENAALIAANETLSTANAENVETIRELTDANEKHADLIAEVSSQKEEIMERTLAVSQKLDKLRLTEAQSALQAPFERGNAANTRRNAALVRFSEGEGR